MQGSDVLLKDFLVDAGLISRSQISDALERAAAQERGLQSVLAEMGVLGEDDLRRAMAHALGVPFITLTRHDIVPEAMILIPEPLARAHNAMAYRVGDGTVEVAVLDMGSLPHIEKIVGTRVLPRLTTAAAMKEALLHYQKHLKEKFGKLLQSGAHVGEALIRHALYSRAGGVHIEPTQLGTMVRYQVGHAMHEAFQLPEHVGTQLVDQLKALAKLLPVARPQEGKFKVEKDGEEVHVRVHAMPAKGGERLHVRLAKAGARGYMLESLGFHGEALHALERQLGRERGLVVVEGAVGSGKSTLLHTLADMLHAPHRTIVWADTAALVRAALRHDPHVIIVDDCSEATLATLAAQAAKRHILVIAATTDDQLFPQADMRVRVTQVRRLCTKSFIDYQTLKRSEGTALEQYANFVRLLNVLKEEKVVERDTAWKDVRFAHATGCSECRDGYIKAEGAEGHVGLQQVEEGGELVGLSLIEDGLFKAIQGQTSVEEVLALL